MAAPSVPLPPYNVPLVDKNGMLSMAWLVWFKNIYKLLANALENADAPSQGSAL